VADAHAVVFQYVPGEAAARSIAFVPNVLEPVFLKAEGKSLLFYRKPVPAGRYTSTMSRSRGNSGRPPYRSKSEN
jgi:hypothetical protein